MIRLIILAIIMIIITILFKIFPKKTISMLLRLAPKNGSIEYYKGYGGMYKIAFWILFTIVLFTGG